MSVGKRRPAWVTTVRAPAKINLHLGVGAPRPDGFHPLLTVYQAIGLYDDLTCSDTDTWHLGATVSDHIDLREVPLDGDNIVDRAADLLAAHHGIARLGEVQIAKAIPVAGGLAGGSADAAAALVALDRLWHAETSDEDLLGLAAQLGSDVPFALIGGTALGTGRGEIVTPIADDGTLVVGDRAVRDRAVDACGLPALRRALPRCLADSAPGRPAARRHRLRRPGPAGRGAAQRPAAGRLRPASRSRTAHRAR